MQYTAARAVTEWCAQFREINYPTHMHAQGVE